MKKLLFILFLISSFHIDAVHAGCIESFQSFLKVKNKEVEKLKYLIKEGKFDVTMLDDRGRTPLHRATDMSKLKIMQILIDAGADVNARDEKGRTPLYFAYIPKIAELLIENGAKVTTKDNNGNTPLNGVTSVTIAKVLIKHGADLFTRNNRGQTPLHQVRKNKLLSRFFIKQGLDAYAGDKDGLTPNFRYPYANSLKTIINHGAEKFSIHSQKEDTNK